MNSIRIDGLEFRFDLEKPIDISVPLQFNGPQPNAYGVDRAASTACEASGIVGDTRRGGSVNFERYSLIPHCNGTHTECVGHITDKRISLRDCLQDVLVPASLVSVEPVRRDGDLVITREILESGFLANGLFSGNNNALIVRTVPNDDSKLTREYGQEIPPYFSIEAIDWIVEQEIAHLIVDLPSIDRIYDNGELHNHRRFWKVETGSFKTNTNTRLRSTITELVYVPNEVEDALYILNLQIAPFASDCAPSRPVLLRSF